VLLLSMLVTFALLRGAGGSPFEPPPGFARVPLPVQNELRRFYNLDEPWPIEFLTYVRNVATLDFGPSQVDRYTTVDQVVEQSLPVTVQLALLALLFAVPVGILLGLASAATTRRAADAAASSFATLLLVLPVFLFAQVASKWLVQEWGLVPGGWDEWRAKVVPALVLGLAPAGYTARLVRAAAVEALREPYVGTARAKGLRRPRIVFVHVLRNSLVPLLAASVPLLALLVTGAFFVEGPFGIPGASAWFLTAAQTRDYPMVMGLTVALTALVLVASLLADVAAAALDPRVRERRT
jgi:ABC-type dipeptide/oligopeptide/nickel transport system permease component